MDSKDDEMDEYEVHLSINEDGMILVGIHDEDQCYPSRMPITKEQAIKLSQQLLTLTELL